MLFLFVLLLSMGGKQAQAQRTLIELSIDSAAILIGEQTVMHLKVTASPERPVQILIPTDTLMRGVEVLAVMPPDSSLIDNRLQIKQDIIITSFDSSLYLLPPVGVVDLNDTIYSNQLALKVSTIPVDVEHPEQFYDIKDVWKPPFVLADYLPWIFGVLIFLFLICVIGYVVQKIRNKESILPSKRAEPKLPPHEQAIKTLGEIKEKKLWQQGLFKAYFTEITDTLRYYIVERFGVNAMEMTSAEILDIIRKESDADSVYENLKQILQLADLVKFAKLHPLPDENDLSMMNAYLFVNQTKRVEIPSPQDKEADEDSDKESSEKKGSDGSILNNR